MSFGFSVGDFIAGAELAYKLIRALSNSQGSTIEYQDAIQELSCIQQTFLHVGQLHASNLLCQATLNAISYIVDSSREVIARFLDKTEKYRKSLSSNGLGASLARDSWRKIGWSLFKKQELVDLKNTLRTRLMAINILVSTATHRNQYGTPEADENEIKEATPNVPEAEPMATITAGITPQEGITGEERTTPDSSSSSTRSANSTKEDSCEDTENKGVVEQPMSKEERDSRRKIVEEAAFKALVELKMLESPRLSPFLKEKEKEIQPRNEPIKFIDALGRRYSFPFQICRTWQGMSEFVKQAFVHVEGMASQVEKGYYDLVDSNGAVLLPQFWEDLVEPGARVTMRMWSESEILEKQASEALLEEIPEETLEEVSSGISQEISEKISHEPSEEISGKVSEETPEDIPKENLEENSRPISDPSGRIDSKQAPDEDSQETPKEMYEQPDRDPLPATFEQVSEPVLQPTSTSDIPKSPAQVYPRDSISKSSFSVSAPNLVKFADWGKRKLKKHGYFG